MDLQARGRPDLAWRCVNRWLEHTGDYEGLQVLGYYRVYRALVRARGGFAVDAAASAARRYRSTGGPCCADGRGAARCNATWRWPWS